MSSGAAIVARFECPASGSARRGSRERSHTRTLHGGPGRSGRLTMIGATRSIALPTKTRVAQGAGSWVRRLLHLEPQVTRSPTDREALTLNVGLAAVVTATASPRPSGPTTAAVTTGARGSGDLLLCHGRHRDLARYRR